MTDARQMDAVKIKNHNGVELSEKHCKFMEKVSFPVKLEL